jgi:hypothetical protein
MLRDRNMNQLSQVTTIYNLQSIALIKIKIRE